MDNTVLTEKELAEVLGLSPWTVRKMRIQENMVHMRIGYRVLYRLESVLKWMDEKEKESQPKEEDNHYGKLRRL